MKINLFTLSAGLLLAMIGRSLGQPCITINTQPQTMSTCLGSEATLMVAATGTGPLAYQWQRGVDQIVFVDLEQATNSALAITNLQYSDVAYYRVIITNVECSVTSQVVFVNGLVAPTISDTGQPTSWPITGLGATVANRVVAPGSAPVAYQWRLNGVSLPSQTRSGIILNNVSPADAGNYDVVVSNTCGSVTSRVVRLEIVVPGVTFTRVTTGPLVTDPSSYWGCAWVDYDNDGLLDFFATTGGNTGTRTFRNRLYRNLGGGAFTAMTAAQVGPIVSDLESWYGCSWGDYDNDGFLDVYVPNYAGANALYRNNGMGGFQRIRDAGTIVSNIAPAQSCPWGDYDNDGFLDLFLASGWPPSRIALHHNQGGNNFTQVTNSPLGTATWSHTEVAVWGDYDNDGDIDLVFSDSGGGPRIKRYENLGQGVFSQVLDAVWDSVVSGIIPAWGDYDNDGSLDLLWCRPARLIHMDSNNQWIVTDLSNAAGTQMALGDYDNDGDQDLFLCGGQSAAYRNQIFQNNGDGTFTELTTMVPATFTGQTSTCAWGDYDNDGFLDLAVVPFYSSTSLLYRNNGNSNHWIGIKLTGTASNRAAIGAKVRVQANIFGQRHWQMRELSAGNRAQNDLRAHFGLGGATNVETLRIEWPSGIVQELQNVPANQYITVVESQGYTGAAPHFTGGVKTAGGIELAFTEPATGARYVLEASTNLVIWTKLMARTSAGGSYQFADTKGTNYTRRFYRLQVP